MKKMKAFVSVLVLSMSSLMLFAAPRVFAATRTWDGGGSDNKMTTAANWSSDTAPSAGDDLVFPANITDRTIINDFTAATSFNSVVFSGTATQDSNYSFTGNSMTLVAGITNSMTGSFNLAQDIGISLILNGTQSFTSGSNTFTFGAIDLGSSALTIDTGMGFSSLEGVISGTGSLTKTGNGSLVVSGDNTYSGATTIGAGFLAASSQTALGTAAAGTTVASGATLYLYQATGDATYAEPLTLNGSGDGLNSGALALGNSFGMGGSVAPPFATSTFTGAITLGSDVKVSAGDRNGKITGAITGSHSIALLDSSTGTFELASSSNGSTTANGILTQAAKETTYSANSPSTFITVNNNETAIVTGIYGNVLVNPKGILKGTGTVGTVTLSGTIAPGMSPGCLHTSDLTFLTGSVYAFEVGGTTACTGYDQIAVTGMVTLAGSLNVSRYNSFKPIAGQKYVIISNDGSDAVVGTFNGLAQGATFKVDGYTFSISYTGGDGNDVELTVTAVAPNTGFALIKNNPVITLVATLGAAGALLLMGRRVLKLAHTTRRR